MKKFWPGREKPSEDMFYPLFGQENCFNLATLGIKQPFSFPTIGKNKFLPLVFLGLAKFFHVKGTIILPFPSAMTVPIKKVRTFFPQRGYGEEKLLVSFVN